jgi:hypothetical protein
MGSIERNERGTAGRRRREALPRQALSAGGGRTIGDTGPAALRIVRLVVNLAIHWGKRVPGDVVWRFGCKGQSELVLGDAAGHTDALTDSAVVEGWPRGGTRGFSHHSVVL